MGRDSKAVQLARHSLLSDRMKEGISYHECLSWYVNQFGKSEGMFQKDRTAIYKVWKISLQKDHETNLIELLNKIEQDRELARGLGNAGAAIQADKLEAQLKGLINKQGEITIQQNTQINNLNLENLTLDDLQGLLQGVK